MRFGVRAASLAAALVGLAPFGAAAAPMKVVSQIPGGNGGWDYATYDASGHRILITRGDTVMVVDADTGAVNGAFAAGKRLHAAIAIPGTSEVALTDSGDHTVKFVDAKDGHLLATVSTPDDTDGAVYDAASQLLVVVCGDAGVVDLIDPKTHQSVREIQLGTPLEFADVDGHGHVFVNESEKAMVARIDMATGAVQATWALSDCRGPTGLAYAQGLVISACGSGRAVVLDATSGATLGSYKVGGFPDAVIFDPVRHLAYVPSALSGDMVAIATSGAQRGQIVETIATHLGARTGALDPRTGKVYLPAADYLPPAKPGGRPQPKPGTFRVVVVGEGG
ncbi:MAG: PQQ-binding-like beta-propeller repeat protein [Alphaproteobacteria bacterium]|nr:PQQ-binding-like beta-propeller repeat protein [Alphaproteobacteria bacterium]